MIDQRLFRTLNRNIGFWLILIFRWELKVKICGKKKDTTFFLFLVLILILNFFFLMRVIIFCSWSYWTVSPCVQGCDHTLKYLKIVMRHKCWSFFQNHIIKAPCILRLGAEWLGSSVHYLSYLCLFWSTL